MPRFRFPPQRVLDQRARLEQERQRTLAELEIQRLRLERQLQQFAADVQQERLAQRECLTILEKMIKLVAELLRHALIEYGREYFLYVTNALPDGDGRLSFCPQILGGG